MKRRINTRRATQLSLALTAAVAIGTLGTAAWAANAASPAGGQAAQANQNQVDVGVYSPQRVFRAYHGRANIMKQLRAAEQKARAAQKTGDQKKEIAAAQTLRKKQAALISQFSKKMKTAIRQIAKKQKLDLVVDRIAFQSGDVATHDLTKAVIKKMNPAAQAKAPMPKMPKLGH